MHSVLFHESLERLYQNGLRNLSKSLTLHGHKLCRTFFNSSFAQNDALKSSAIGLCTLSDGSTGAAAVLEKKLRILTHPRALNVFFSILLLVQPPLLLLTSVWYGRVFLLLIPSES